MKPKQNRIKNHKNLTAHESSSLSLSIQGRAAEELVELTSDPF